MSLINIFASVRLWARGPSQLLSVRVGHSDFRQKVRRQNVSAFAQHLVGGVGGLPQCARRRLELDLRLDQQLLGRLCLTRCGHYWRLQECVQVIPECEILLRCSKHGKVNQMQFPQNPIHLPKMVWKTEFSFLIRRVLGDFGEEWLDSLASWPIASFTFEIVIISARERGLD